LGACFLNLEQPSMKAIKTYPTRVEADLARIALEAAGVPSTVVGIGVSMEGGARRAVARAGRSNRSGAQGA